MAKTTTTVKYTFDSDDAVIAAAEGIAYRRYRATVEGIVEDLKRAIADKEVTDSDGATEWIEQTVDGCGDVIYTGRAMEVCRQSRNEDAYYDEGMYNADDFDGAIPWSKLAYFALLADVNEEIGDLDELFTEPEPDEDEDEPAMIPAGTRVIVTPTALGLVTSYPAATWLTSSQSVTLLEDCPNATLDVIDVRLDDGTEESVYSFNVVEVDEPKPAD